MTSDNLGSPRVITDNGGNVSSRRDFMPFGEDLNVGVGGRNTVNKYSATTDNVRQKFTGYEKDDETGLDFAEARYYNNLHGRFTAVDPLLASGLSSNPQTFNRYAYVSNNPINATDPSGLNAVYAFSLGVSPMGSGTGDPYSSSPFMQMPEKVATSSRILTRGQDWVSRSLERLRKKFADSLPKLDVAATGTSSPTVGYGRVTSFTRTTIDWSWINRFTGTKITDIGPTPDTTVARIVYSSVSTGEEPNEDPLYGIFGNDDRGHIIGAALGGNGGKRNLFSQSLSINRGAYRSLEREIRQTLTNNQSLTAVITVNQYYYNQAGFVSVATALAETQETKYRVGWLTYDVRFVNPQGETVRTISDYFSNSRFSWRPR